jgi:hypothetical protein
VVVSDDTGFEDHNEHAPWLFTMTARGELDAAPLVVAGIDQLNDVESVALASDGSLWLLSSASFSKKGKRSAARQSLVHVDLRNGAARATGSVALADLLDRAKIGQRTALGISDTSNLDFEALAMRGGSLFIGLKSPLDPDNRALIWTIANPERLLTGSLDGAGAALWGKVPLLVDAEGRTVPGGIADMTFIDASTLVIAATASGIDPTTQTGALYVAREDGRALAATRVRAFEGLKPEGVALTPDRGALTIVFDRGSEPAQWLQLSLATVLEARAR